MSHKLSAIGYQLQALILAGGLGTRLRSVIADKPKPMADVAGRPFLEYQIDWLRRHGITRIVLCVGYRAEQIQAYFQDGTRWQVDIAYAVEREPLGTAGAIKNAQTLIQGAFLALNGDTFVDLDLDGLLEFHRAQTEQDDKALGTLGLVYADDTGAYGAIELDESQRIVRFREKTGRTGAGLINAGFYLLEPGILDFIPAGQKVSIEEKTFPLVLEKGWHLYGYPTQGYFVDIGTPEGYARFKGYVEGKQQ